MYRRVLQLFLYLLCINTEDILLGASRKFVHQRDMSEHCKRRVVPSVFLGRHVMDANSQIMQFSQLEVPYSCSLSVRAEAGSNIILIVQLLSEDTLIEACNLSGDQLIVYEFGETFGGYWGPIPNVIMRESARNYTQYYTLKRTRPPTQRTRKPHSTVKKILMVTEKQSTVKEQEYYTMDVPIVNVSGNFQLGPRHETNDSEDLFNYIYDVTPRTGVEYETSIMPLVQFSIRQQSNGYEGGDRRYELDYDSKGFTMDPRLIFNTAKKKKTSFRKNWKANRRFRHRSKSTSMFRRRENKKLLTVQSLFIDEPVTPSIATLDTNYFTNPWGLVNGIIKSINVTTVRSTVFQNETHRHIIDQISNSHHNSSVYLARNISIYNVDISTNGSKTVFEDGADANQFVSNSTKIDEIKGVTMPASSLLHTSVQTSSSPTLDLDELKTEYNLESKNDRIEIYNITDEINMTADILSAKNELLTEITTVTSTTMNKSIKKIFRTGAMVDHESWENIVQAAPVMAVVLNNTEPLINNTMKDVFNKRKHKRSIQSLEIERSRPRNLTTKRALVSDTPPFEDINDISRLVELEDDETGSRVALRYLRHYAGPAVYRLCDLSRQSLTQTFLFNSSRIVIAVSNFTLDRMIIVLTPAQTLQSGVSQCPEGQLECQVVGTRVCIDSLNACDGVPNCGSYEIYDEERLRCGAARGVRRGESVSVAALTVLAVVLTAGYIALYWLERCVPRVSDAFFIYTDSSENELLLDSIMRSPNDDEDPSNKMNYLGHFFDDDVLYQDLNAEERNVHICKKIFNACWKLLGFRKIQKPSEKVITENQTPTREASRIFSFTQLELKKFGKIQFKEEGVQTGDSLEIEELSNQQNKKEKNSLSSFIKFKAATSNQHERRQDSELNLIKFSKESRSLSSRSDLMSYESRNSMTRRHAVGIATEREIEIENTIYEHVPTPLNTTNIPVTCEVHTETKKAVDSSKRLRFDEELKMISNIDEDEDDWPAESSTSKRRNNVDSGKIGEVQEPEGSSRDFMRFWGAKGKKGKKKKLKHLYGQ